MHDRDPTRLDGETAATSGSTSQSVLDRVRLGSVEDQRLLVALYSPLVLNVYIKKTVVEEIEQREEIRNAVFATVFKKIEANGFARQGRGAFRAWLRSITRKKVGDFIRRRRRREARDRGTAGRLDDLPDAMQDGGDVPESGLEEAILVRQAMEVVRGQVEPATYEMARLQLVDGASAAEAGVALGRTANAAYVAKCRVKRRLRELLARFEIRDVGDDRFAGDSGGPT